MKLNLFVLVILSSLCMSAAFCVAEERASLNAQEYDCRQSIQQCLALRDDAQRECYRSPSLSDKCTFSSLRYLVTMRINAENELSNRECLRRIDSELSGLLAKDSYSYREIKNLEQRLSQCKQNTTDELMQP